MPLHWTISHRHGLVLAIARNHVTFEDIDGYLTALVAERALPYRKLFDLSFAPAALPVEHVRRLADRARTLKIDYVLGPVAVVVGSDDAQAAAQLYAKLATAERPITVFRDITEARPWLDAQPLPFGRTPPRRR